MVGNEAGRHEGRREIAGQLTAIGIVKGSQFAPNDHDRAIIDDAVRIANAATRVSSRTASRPDTRAGPGQQYQQPDHVFCRHLDIAEFLFDTCIYTNRDVSCAKREIIIIGEPTSPAS